jgi:hypothetical protein
LLPARRNVWRLSASQRAPDKTLRGSRTPLTQTVPQIAHHRLATLTGVPARLAIVCERKAWAS